jgi:hypothetical protein
LSPRELGSVGGAIGVASVGLVSGRRVSEPIGSPAALIAEASVKSASVSRLARLSSLFFRSIG